MAGSARIPDAVLADMLQRLAIAVTAGIDLRRAWDAEVARVPWRWRPAVARVGSRLHAGDGLGESCAASDGAIPAVVAGMLLVGDRTGRLAEVLGETAKAVSRSLAARRSLQASLVGPAIRLVMALLAILVMIVVAGMSRGIDGRPLDFLGLGLTGSRGVTIVLTAVAALGAAAVVAAVAIKRSWSRRAAAWAIGRRLPVVGPTAIAMESAAWCRAAALAAHAGVGPGEMVELASQAAPGLPFDRQRLEARLRGGADLPEALASSGSLSREVIEAVAVGEMTGTTAETLDRVADLLDDRARRGLAAVVQAAGFLAWAVAAAVVAMVVIRVVATYARMINDLTR